LGLIGFGGSFNLPTFAQHDSVEEEHGWVTKMAHTTRKAFSTPMPAPSTSREVCRVYFTPILDETLVNTPTFFAAMELDMLHKRSGIIWSRANVRGGHWIVVPINKKEHLRPGRILAENTWQRLNLAKAFQAKVWVPQKRNQIL
jgi:hypothetical protein